MCIIYVMFVGIDAFGCDQGRSGIGLYLLSLLANLPKDDTISYELFGSEFEKYTYSSVADKINYLGIKVSDTVASEIAWHKHRASSFISKQGYDVTLFPVASKYLPKKFNVPGVAVVNDVVSKIAEYKNNPLYAIYIKHGLKKCKKIIVPSLFVKKDLIALGIPSSKIEVIYNGINHSLFYPREIINNDVVNINPFAIKRPYIICASKLQSKEKKHVELIKAFSLFKKNTGLPHRLVIAGEEGAYSEAIHKAVASSDYSSDIFLTGFFPHESLPELYSCADACICPSVIEGVGLPVLEAFACRIPVACAKAGALPEMAGNHALYFNPDDIPAFAEAIEKIVSDKNLREQLLSGSIDWVKRFSWEKTAQRTMEVLSSVALS